MEEQNSRIAKWLKKQRDASRKPSSASSQGEWSERGQPTYREIRRHSRQLEDEAFTRWRAARADLFKLSEREIAETLGKRCEHCDALLVPAKMEIEVVGRLRQSLRWPDLCPECGQVWSSLLEPMATKEITQSELMARRGIPPALQEKTFAAYHLREGCQAGQWLAHVSLYRDEIMAGSLKEKNWLILHGAPGLGKTHLALALLMDLWAKGKKDWRFLVWPEYTDRIRETFGPDSAETEGKVKREAMDPWLVVLDDIDKAGLSDWQKSTLFLVLNHRLNEGKPTVLTFNWGPGEADPLAPGRLALEEYLGRYNLDRVIEATWRTVEFTGESYRSGMDWGGQDWVGDKF